jgi:probable phosphomutase (TIGR03848 family)
VPPVVTVLLVRHGRSSANAAATLAGRASGVRLSDDGHAQAAAVAGRLAGLPVAAVISSPLERCTETAAPIAAALGLTSETDDRLVECDYGDWTGRPLAELSKDPAWRVVQDHASAAVFPGGESLRGMQQRAVDAVRDRNARLAPGGLWVAVTHADVIKAVLADALGMHLDAFQRIVVDVASVSVIRYTPLRPFVSRVNDRGGSYDDLIPSPSNDDSDTPDQGPDRGPDRSSDAVVGGPPGAPAPTMPASSPSDRSA